MLKESAIVKVDEILSNLELYMWKQTAYLLIFIAKVVEISSIFEIFSQEIIQKTRRR